MRIVLTIWLLVLLAACGPNTTTDFVKRGDDAMALAHYDIAVIEYKNAIRLSPKDSQLRFLLGQAYIALNQPVDAEKELTRALEYSHPAQDIVPLLSDVYRALGNDKSLHQLSRKVQDLAPKASAKLKLYQVESFVKTGQHHKARILIREISQLPGSDEYGQLALAYELVIRNQLDGAIGQLEQLLQTYPNQKHALIFKADLQLNNQQPANAALTYQQYIDIYPDDNEAKLALARLYVSLNQDAKAEPFIDDLLVSYPAVPLLLQLKSSIQLRLKDYVNAYRYAEQALVINPEDDGSRLIAGMSAYLLNDKKNAYRHLALIASVLPNTHPALRLLADSQLALGLTLEASETAEQFEQLTEQDATLLSKVGQALYQQGDIAKAKGLLAKQPEQLNSTKALTNVGILKLSLNELSGIIDIEKAVAHLMEEGQTLTSLQLQTTLAQAYLHSQQYEKALTLADRWLQIDGHRFNGHVLQAKVFNKQQDFERAKAAYQDALTIKPDSHEVKFALIELTRPDSKDAAEQMLATLDEFVVNYPDYRPAITLHYMLSKRLGIAESMTQHILGRLEGLVDKKAHQIVLAKFHALEGRTEQAIALFESLKTQRPEPFWSQLARVYIQNKEFDKAATLYNDWFEIMPNHPTAIAGKIRTYQAQGNVAEALLLSTRYINTLGGQDIDLQLMHLQLLSQNKQFDKTKGFLASLPRHVLNLPFVKGVKGQMQLIEGQAAVALDNLKVAYKAIPSSQNASFVFTALSHVSGAPSALRFLKLHLTKQPNDIVNTLRYADSQIGKDNNEAIAYYKKVLVLQDNHIPSLNNLAHLLDRQGQTEDALGFAQQAFQLSPNRVDVLDTLGVIELKLGQYHEALQHLQQAYDMETGTHPDKFIVDYIEALLRNGQAKLAQRRIAQHDIEDRKQQQRLDRLIAENL